MEIVLDFHPSQIKKGVFPFFCTIYLDCSISAGKHFTSYQQLSCDGSSKKKKRLIWFQGMLEWHLLFKAWLGSRLHVKRRKVWDETKFTDWFTIRAPQVCLVKWKLSSVAHEKAWNRKTPICISPKKPPLVLMWLSLSHDTFSLVNMWYFVCFYSY